MLGFFLWGIFRKKQSARTTSKFSSTEKIHLDDCTVKKWHKAMGFCIPKPCRYFNVAPNCIRGSGNHLSGSPRSQRKTKESCILVSMPQILPEEEIAPACR
jgi:hypothetical protein